MKDSIGDRMKSNYENRARHYLTRRIPVIIRLDGKAFHTLTKGCEKPFDKDFKTCMEITAMRLLEEIQGAKCVYTQSDEISILVTDYDKLETSAWFNYNIQKMCSITAAQATYTFSSLFGKKGLFDARCFNIPKEEVVNYFIWRQKDWERNSLSMYARSVFSHNQLHKKNREEIHEMLFKQGMNWALLEDKWKRGTFITKDGYSFPIFNDDRYVIDIYLKNGEE